MNEGLLLIIIIAGWFVLNRFICRASASAPDSAPMGRIPVRAEKTRMILII